MESRYKKTPRSPETVKNLERRLNRLIGQLNGISRMIEENRYCGDVLIQVSAARKALEEIGNQILRDHVQSCVVEKIREEDLSVVDELLDLIKRTQ